MVAVRIRGARLAGVIALVAITNPVPAHVRLLSEPAGVVLITLDTTRVDRLSPYGFLDISLPHLERLAREGVVFDQATSVAPLTLPAHTTILTGLLPPNHGVRDNADPPLAESQATLADVLRTAGLRTGAFVGSAVLDPDRGLRQGFDVYVGADVESHQAAPPRQRRADRVVTEALGWLDTAGERFFLWTHLYDPHRPYDPPEPYRTRYAHSPYLGEIAFADSQIGRLLEELERRDLLNRTVVIVAGDHGESLGERGERDHGIFIYDNVLRVPLIVRSPGVAPSRVGELVRLTDLMPTILDLIGVAGPRTDGESLAGLMQGRRRGLDLETYAESLYPARLGCSPLRALRDRRFKLIDGPRPELYDLERDPFELHDISGDRPALARAMSTRAAAIAKGRGLFRERAAVVAPDLHGRLTALGYISAAVVDAPRQAPLPDPRDCIRAWPD
jgi:choline-sulfatase